MSESVRLQKLLANWGVASRRNIEKMIAAGRIKIAGETLLSQGFSVDPENLPEIRIDDKIILPPAKQNHLIYMLFKPLDVVTTLSDERGRRTINEFLPPGRRLYPIGRLDRDSTGLLLVTNYGELTNRLLHPSYKVEKEYCVSIDGPPLTPVEEAEFRSGVAIEDGFTAPCQLYQQKNSQDYTVIIREGKKRQVRRMFASFGRKVTRLHRVRFGPLQLGKMRPGELRELTRTEKSALLQAAGLTD